MVVDDRYEEVQKLDARIEALKLRRAKLLRNELEREWDRLIAKFRKLGEPLPTEKRPLRKKRGGSRRPSKYDELFAPILACEEINIPDLQKKDAVFGHPQVLSALYRRLRELGYQSGGRGRWIK